MRVAKQLKQEKLATTKRDQFMDLDVIPGMSVICERLLSLANNILTDTRKCTSPVLFEVLRFLKVNSNLWGAYSVGKAMGGQTSELEERNWNEGSTYDNGE